MQTDQPRAPGEGNLPAVPDRDEMVPLPPEDAAAHLQQAAGRVLREQREHRTRSLKGPVPGVKDW